MFVTISSECCHDKFSTQFWQGILIDYDGVNNYKVYNSLTKRIKTYCNVEFHEYKTTHNTDINNKFQYTEFNKYKKSKTVKINISESTDQHTSTEFF